MFLTFTNTFDQKQETAT